MLHRLAALVLTFAFLAAPIQAGLFHRKPKKVQAKYGVSKTSHNKQVEKARAQARRNRQQQLRHTPKKPVEIREKHTEPAATSAPPPTSTTPEK